MPLDSFFKEKKPLIGMIHVEALPGSPDAQKTVSEIVSAALAEAEIYQTGGFAGLLIENMRDLPYLRGAVGPEITACLAVVARAVRTFSQLPVGLQILAGANQEALAVAHAAGLDFIRAEGFAFAHVADEGLLQACAGPLLRYRKNIGAGRVQVWADIKKKHSAHAITADVSLGETAAAAEFMRGDAVIITGGSTGRPPTLADVLEAKACCGLPIILGSGVTPDNLAEFYPSADAFIIGSYCKREGFWRNELDPARVRQMADAAARCKGI